MKECEVTAVDGYLNPQDEWIEVELTPKQARAAELYASGMLKKDIANEVGVTPQTISIWFADSDFVVYTNRLRKEALKAARTSLQQLSTKAMETLGDLLSEPTADRVRLQAAITVLECSGIKPTKDSIMFGAGIGPDTFEAFAREQILLSQFLG